MEEEMTNLHHKAPLKCGGGVWYLHSSPPSSTCLWAIFKFLLKILWSNHFYLYLIIMKDRWDCEWECRQKLTLMNVGFWGDSSTNASQEHKNHWKTPWPARRKVGVGYLIPISDHSSFSPHVAYASRCMLHFCVLTVRDRGSVAPGCGVGFHSIIQLQSGSA